MERTKKYDLEQIAHGSFDDQGFRVDTYVIRLTPELLNEYLFEVVSNLDGCDFDSHDEYLAYLDRKREKHEAFRAKMLEAVTGRADCEGGCATQNVGEIFTVVVFTKL